MITKDWRAAARSWCFPMSQKPYRSVALEKRQETESNSTYTCSIIDTCGHYLWKAIAAQASRRGTPNLDSKCEGFVVSIEGPAYFW